MSQPGDIRVGILGCGGFAGAHARRYRAIPGVTIAALGDVSAVNIDNLIGRRLADYQPAPVHYADAATMFTEAGLDAVSILTPHTLHADHAIAALEAGLHVLVEKPMVTTAADGERLREAVRSSGKILMPGYNPVYTAPVAWLRRAVADRCFGDLKLVTAWLAQDWKNLTAGSWRQDPALAGAGQSMDSGAHLLAGLCFCLGCLPEIVYARQENRGTAVDIDTSLTMTFPGGVPAAIAIGGDSKGSGGGGTFIFAEVRVEVDLWGGQSIAVFPEDRAPADLPVDGVETDPNARFIAVIRGEAEAPVDVGFGLDQARLHEAIQLSVAENRPVTIGSMAEIRGDA